MRTPRGHEKNNAETIAGPALLVGNATQGDGRSTLSLPWCLAASHMAMCETGSHQSL